MDILDLISMRDIHSSNKPCLLCSAKEEIIRLRSLNESLERQILDSELKNK